MKHLARQSGLDRRMLTFMALSIFVFCLLPVGMYLAVPAWEEMPTEDRFVRGTAMAAVILVASAQFKSSDLRFVLAGRVAAALALYRQMPDGLRDDRRENRR